MCCPHVFGHSVTITRIWLGTLHIHDMLPTPHFRLPLFRCLEIYFNGNISNTVRDVKLCLVRFLAKKTEISRTRDMAGNPFVIET